MTEIRFYHLERQSLDQVLPLLVQKALAGGKKAVIKLPSEDEVGRMNDLLWTFSPDSFIPHGAGKDGFSAEQPVWLTALDENPNGAQILFLANGASSEIIGNFELCCEIFDGRDTERLTEMRRRWQAYKAQDFEITYWQQGPSGWEKKA